MATKFQQTEVRFLSQFRSLRMQRQTQGETFVNGNVKNDPSRPEVTYEFEKGVLTLRAGQDMMLDGQDPETGELVEQDAISWIRTTPEYGVDFIEVEPIAPDPGPLFMEIGRLTAEKDLAGLVALGDEESESWERENVLTAIRDAVALVSEKTEKQPVKAS